MSEEDIIKRRLIFDGDGTGEDRRLNILVKMIMKWTSATEDTEEESKIIYDKILAQLALVEHGRKRSDLVHRQTAKQLEQYKHLHIEMEANISAKRHEIAKQKSELEKAKTIKQNRIEYDLLAKSIEKEPPRTDMQKKLKLLKSELSDLALEKKSLEHEFDVRKRQCNVVSTSANALAELLVNDSKKKSKDDSEAMDCILKSEPMSE